MEAGKPAKAPHVRRTIYFSGRVQGVGFRQTTVLLSDGREVTGLVRNLSDGRVELIAEGERSELDRFQRSIEEALRENIREIRATDSPPTGEYASFRVAL